MYHVPHRLPSASQHTECALGQKHVCAWLGRCWSRWRESSTGPSWLRLSTGESSCRGASMGVMSPQICRPHAWACMKSCQGPTCRFPVATRSASLSAVAPANTRSSKHQKCAKPIFNHGRRLFVWCQSGDWSQFAWPYSGSRDASSELFCSCTCSGSAWGLKQPSFAGSGWEDGGRVGHSIQPSSEAYALAC